MAGNEIKDSAKAIQEVAKLGTEATKAARDAGGFLARMFGSLWDQANGILEDRLAFHCAMQRIKFLKRFEDKRAQMGLGGPLKLISLKFGVPLLEAVTMEPDPDLRDMMATLLAKATDEASQQEPRAAFVDILRSMEPLDAKVLIAAYRAPQADPRDTTHRTILTGGLPDGFYVSKSGLPAGPPQPSAHVAIALWNLVRLGCLSPGGGWGGVSMISVVTVTALGMAVVEATTLPAQRERFVPVETA